MTIDEIKKWMLESSGFPVTQANAEYLERFQAIAFQAGAASRDAYIEQLELALLQVRKAICGDIHNTDDLLDLIASRDAEIDELVAALKPFGAIDLVESRLPAEFAMLILRARAPQPKKVKRLGWWNPVTGTLRLAYESVDYDEASWVRYPKLDDGVEEC